MVSPDMLLKLNQTNLTNGKVTKSDYMDWCNYLTSPNMIFNYEGYDHLGIWGSEEAGYFNEYYKNNNNNTYLATFKGFSILTSLNQKKYLKQKDILNMLKNNIPVAFEIGIGPLTYFLDLDSKIYRYMI